MTLPTRADRGHSNRYLSWLAAFACIWAVPTLAQQASGVTPRIGILEWGTCEDSWLLSEDGPLIRGFHDLGYVRDETVVFDCRAADGSYDRLDAAAAELAAIPVDVIVSDNQPAGHAARRASMSIPIVSIISGDPVAAGLAESLARPGGNLTGVSYYATELTAKRLELLKELLPGLSSVGILSNPELLYMPFESDAVEAGAGLGLDIKVYHISTAEDLGPAFDRMKRDGVGAVFVLPDPLLSNLADPIAALSIVNGLPSMAWGGWFTGAGVLMSYSTDYVALTYRLASYVDRILKGSPPGELPIEQPTTFDLSINLKTADALGVEVPPSILLLASEVIE